MNRSLFNKISIVESLGKHDRKTGGLLYEDIKMLELFHERGVAVEHASISSKNDLYNHIDLLTHDARANRIFPILQIDVHGTSDRKGIALNSGENILWRDLCNKLRELNSVSKGNLIIVMSSCFGVHIQSGIDLFNRAPFWAVMSPLNQVSPDDIQKSLGEFYRDIFDGSTDSNDIPTHAAFKLITTDSAFLHFWKTYLDDKAPDDIMSQHAKSLHRESKANNQKIKLEDIKAQLALSGQNEILDRLKYFLFADVEPYNLYKVKFSSSEEIIEDFKSDMYDY